MTGELRGRMRAQWLGRVEARLRLGTWSSAAAFNADSFDSALDFGRLCVSAGSFLSTQ